MTTLRLVTTPFGWRGVAVLMTCAAALGGHRASTRDGLSPQDLPEGQGRAIVLRLCDSSCHGIDQFIDERRSRSKWAQTIEEMQSRGATASDEDFKAVVSYLAAHLGVPVKINEASAKQIDDALDLSPGQAEAIVKYRDEHGKFADWSALMKVPGLDAKKLEEQKAIVAF